MIDVAPPATAVWYDLAVTTAEVLAILRLTEQDVDTGRIEAAVPAAATLIDEFLDGVTAVPGPPPSPKLQQALDQVTIELYQRRVAVPGLDLARILDPVRSELLGSKERFGVA